jgi:hypothetical protein
MSDRTILERNKAVLWARDVVGRADQYYIATTSGADGWVVLSTPEGVEVARFNLLSSGAVPLEQLVTRLDGKELVTAGLSENMVRLLRGRGVVTHDLMEYQSLYLTGVDVAPVGFDVPPNNLPHWTRDMLTRMAGSSLVLDQADTGAGRWTSAHFKPTPSMMEKLKSLIKP